MNIKINELKKVLNSPIITWLLVLFIVFNAFVIYQNSYFKDELKVLNKLVDRFGYKIDDEMLGKFKEYYDEQLYRLNEITNKKLSKNFKNMQEFYNDHKYGLKEIYTQAEIDLIVELGIIETYYNEILGIDEIYSKINIMDIAEREIMKYSLGGKAAATVRKQYKAFSERFKQLIENKEHKNLFFMGQVYRMHSLLFRKLFRIIIFEIIILVVLTTAYLVNYEFDSNTELLTYTSKRGRNLIIDKLWASVFSSLVITTIILSITLSLYFKVFDYSRLWNVPISSYFNSEYVDISSGISLLYFAWWNMSFIKYMIFSIGLIYLITLIFNGIAFVLAIHVKNTYFSFFIFAIIFGLFLIVPNFLPRNSNLIFMGAFTPFFLILNPHVWFMESGAFTTFKYYELITVSIWFLILLVLGMLSIKKFKRQDI